MGKGSIIQREKKRKLGGGGNEEVKITQGRRPTVGRKARGKKKKKNQLTKVKACRWEEVDGKKENRAT